jgi:diguanylate cyclase (GGDEF)-like protein
LEEDLTTDLSELEDHLDGMLHRVEHNSNTLKLLQRFEMQLLSLNSLAEMIEFILDQSRELFELDIISLCLVDPKGDIAKFLEYDRYDYHAKDNLLLISEEQLVAKDGFLSKPPFLGTYQAEDCDAFFPAAAKKPVSVAIIPLLRRGKCIGALNLGSYQTNRFVQNMATDFVQHLGSVIGICLENNINFETMRRTTLIDSLTNVNNRRFLEQRIDEELDRSKRTQQPLSCLFLDIDFFKRINDQYGHQAGDFVLAQVAGVIKKQLRSNDVLSRYGGEEFVVLLSQSDQKIAREIAERIRLRVGVFKMEFANKVIPVTISIGVATFQPDKLNRKPTADIAVILVKAADTALYAAKTNGRNRVEEGGLLGG